MSRPGRPSPTDAESLPEEGSVPSLRVSRENRARLRRDGHFVLYWMISARRLDSNFALPALDHEVEPVPYPGGGKAG